MFIFVLPVALAALAFGARFLKNVGETGHQRLDAGSVALSIPAFGGLVYGLSRIGAAPPGSGPNLQAIAALATGVAAMALFVARQLRLQRTGAPLLDLRALNYRMFTVSTLLMVVAMMALFGAVLLLPIYLQSARHVDAQTTGLILLPGGLIMGLSGPLIGWLFDRIGPLPLTVSGSTLMVLCLWPYSQLGHTTALWWIVTVQTALNLALALMFTPAFTTGLNPLPPPLYSHGSAIMGTLQQVAGAAGTALLVSIYAGVPGKGDVVAGMRAAFLAATLIAVGAVVLAALMRKTAPEDS